MEDTIAAVATGLSEGGISIIRISGPLSISIADKIFKAKSSKDMFSMKTYSMRYGHIVHSNSGSVIDEVIVSLMRGPKSYTGEDVVEINCHGGIVSATTILEEVIKNGARLAEPGEFTKRAFLNGRIDLAQAEAVIDIIRAKTDISLKSAVLQSGGNISVEINKLRNKILEVIAHIEAVVDFPEDDIEDITSETVKNIVNGIINEIDKLIETSASGKVLREGLNMVIVGKPNVGKSSFLNRILMENRAIVTDIPGTTRDVIEETLNIDGIPINIVDTAGIRDTEDYIEKIGVEKSKKKILEADLILLILDKASGITDTDEKIIKFIKEKKCIVLLNKADIGDKINNISGKINTEYIIDISAKTGFGIDEFKKSLKLMFFNGNIDFGNVLITNMRHKEGLVRARAALISSLGVLDNTASIDLASIDLQNAWSTLGEITGETLQEDIIDKIFSEFCIGK